MKRSAYLENKVLVIALREFSAAADEIERANAVLLDEAPHSEAEVNEAIGKISRVLPSLLTAVPGMLAAIETVETGEPFRMGQFVP